MANAEFSQKIFEALENLDQEKVKSLVDSDRTDNGMLSVDMILRALDMEQEDMAILILMAMHRHYSLTDESSQKLIAHAARFGLHNFLRTLVTLENGHHSLTDQVLKDLKLGRMTTVVQGNKMHNSQLHDCVINGETTAMAFLYALAGVPVNAQNKTGDSALHLAVRDENEEMVETLLQCGVSPMLRNKLGQTASDMAIQLNNDSMALMIRSYEPGLSWGLEHGDARVVVRALRRWVSPHSLLDASGDGRTGLMLSQELGLGLHCTVGQGFLDSLLLVHRVMASDLRGVRFMLGDRHLAPNLNVNLKHPDSGMTPLAAAVRNNNPVMITELLNHGAIVNTRAYNVPLVTLSIKWMTPFAIIQDLLEKDKEQSHSELASIWDERDPDGHTLFLRAIQCGRPIAELEKLLYMSPGHQCLTHRSGITQLNARELAMELERWEVVELIDSAVTKLFVNTNRSDTARTALMKLAISFYDRSNFETAAEMALNIVGAAAGEHVDRFMTMLSAIEDGGVALMRAVMNNDYTGVKALNQADYVDKNGYTALTRAIVLNRYDIAEWLIAERPQLKFIGDNDNCYPLHYAYALPQDFGDKYVALLLARDGDVLQELCDKDGSIPCHYRQRANSAIIRARIEGVATRGVHGIHN